MIEPLDVLANFRDLGGLTLVDGGTTRANTLLRSDAPYSGDRVPVGVPWPPTTVIDLRDESEGSSADWWPDGTRVVNNPLFTGARLDRVADIPLAKVYSGILSTAATRITSVLNAFDASGPTLVHCAAGKDRTGVVVAVALALAGVDRGAIVSDYTRTERSMDGVYARLQARGTVPFGVDRDHAILGTPTVAIETVLDRTGKAEGGVWGWFEANGGDTVGFRQWVESFRDDADSH